MSDRATPLHPTDRSCCCTNRPVVRVILPGREDLLLCASHYRRSSVKLADAGARVFDETGTLFATGVGR